MHPQSLLIVFNNPPQIRLQDALLEDNASARIDGVSVFSSVAPWNSMHDLLVDRETQILAGFIYPVADRERAAIASICQSLPAQVVRYCISLNSAANALSDPQFQRAKTLREAGEQSVSVKQFPEILKPYRQAIRSCLLGEIEPNGLPPEIRMVAAEYFKQASESEWSSEKARVEITWVNKPVIAKLPSYFPSAFEIELAQYFAEDIWFYREDNNEIYAVGFNYLSETLEEYKLQLPDAFLTAA